MRQGQGLQESSIAPESSWTPPAEFPEWQDAEILGLDCETYDPNLQRLGPGGIRGDGEVIGVSLSNGEESIYLPFAHLGGGNLDKQRVVDWLRQILGQSGRKLIIGANLQYEIEWLGTLGIPLAHHDFWDIQTVDALISEEEPTGYSLDAVAKRWLGGTGKDEQLLKEAAAAHNVNPKDEMWKLHAKYVGPYAEADARLPIDIWRKQRTEVERQGLNRIVGLEMEVLPILAAMRRQGIPVDLERARKLEEECEKEEKELIMQIREQVGWPIDCWSNHQLARLADQVGQPYMRTPKGNPSFDKVFLAGAQNPLFQNIGIWRELNRLRTTFIRDWFRTHTFNGRVHPSWWQLASDDGGTRTGRLSASKPNPQQMPSRSDLAGKIREIFRVERGFWAKLDYSQQEPRLLVHYATIRKFDRAEEIARRYREDKEADIYQILAQAAGLPRPTAKQLTLARCYGMGPKKFARQQGIELEEAKELLQQFDDSVPFVKQIAKDAERLAARRGWIRTLGGRLRHFNLWEAVDGEGVVISEPRPLEALQYAFPKANHRRAFTYKALNSLIQGSAADMTKKAMADIWAEFELAPMMQVHDELNYNVNNVTEAETLRTYMEKAYSLNVPVVVDLDLGETWK